MPVHAYVGLPRSGKTYTAVEQVILPALRLGRVVVTNVPMKRDAVVRDIPAAEGLLREFPQQAIVANPDAIFEHCPNGCVVVLDEVWRFWPAGKKVDKIPEAFKSFLAEHGHRVDVAGNAMQIVLITQDLAQISAFARQQVEQTFRTLKLTSVGFHKKFRTDVFGGPISGPNPPEAQRLRQIFGTYSPKVYQYYTSHTLSEAGEGAANEVAIDGRGNVLMRPIILCLPFLVLGLIWFGWTHLHKPTRDLARGIGTAGAAAVGGAPPSLFTSSPPRSNAKEEPSWWVSGVLRGFPDPIGEIAMVTDGERTVWVELSSCRVSRFDVSCPYGGRYWSMRGESRPMPSGPLGSSAPSVAPGSGGITPARPSRSAGGRGKEVAARG